MTPGPDPAELDDDQLLEVLASALRSTDPVPPVVLAGALGAETWRTIDVELAELVFDSALESTGTRAGTAALAREVTFRVGEVEIELLVTDQQGAPLEGQIIPPAGDLAELVSMSSTSAGATTSIDELGRFRFDSLPNGPVRIGIRLTSGWVHTTWVVLRAG
jgi:hypothetical protein